MSWTCPHCGTLQVVTDAALARGYVNLEIGMFAERKNYPGALYCGVYLTAIRCANIPCRKTTLTAAAGTGKNGQSTMLDGSQFFGGQVYPGSVGKPFPEHVPAFLLEDYQEAWAVITLSPKSSATLARRCLQAMIRDFCGITEKSLFKEIVTLEKLLKQDKLPKGVEAETIEAMQALREVGNIGAHMKEVDGKILDVDPDEAEKLLALIEMLFADWYVARGKRQQRLAAIKGVGESKKLEEGAAASAASVAPSPGDNIEPVAD